MLPQSRSLLFHFLIWEWWKYVKFPTMGVKDGSAYCRYRFGLAHIFRSSPLHPAPGFICNLRTNVTIFTQHVPSLLLSKKWLNVDVLFLLVLFAVVPTDIVVSRTKIGFGRKSHRRCMRLVATTPTLNVRIPAYPLFGISPLRHQRPRLFRTFLLFFSGLCMCYHKHIAHIRS